MATDIKVTHTPGPWTPARIHYPKGLDISFEVNAGAAVVCQTVMREIKDDADAIRTDEANARLIAAAPDLLAQLKDAVIWIEEYVAPVALNQKAVERVLAGFNAAIAKADGGQ